MERKPNVLFIMSDHTNAQSVAPGSQCLTPNVDGLAAEGVRFGRCYTTNAICSPARASLMTALYPSTHGMWDCTHTQRREWVDVPAERFTYFSRLFADAGYRTGYFGKWHVEQSKKLDDFGWQEYDCTTITSARGGTRIPGSEVVVPKEGYRDYLLAACAEGMQSHPAYDRGIEFLRTVAGGNEPFFCFVSTAEPHDPYIPPRRFLDMYDIDAVRVSPTLREEPAGKPEVIRRMRSVWSTMTDQQWQRVAASYWALITFLDSEVGRILDVLRETGAYENTIVVFTADHGDMLGGHGLATKGVGTSYEEVYNIPLVMRVPGQARRGEDGETLCSLVDLAPSLLDLCGLPPLPNAHGRSLRPVLEATAEAGDWRDAYGEFFGQRFVYTQRIVWHENWKYVFSPGGIDELYNLADDPYERSNLADDPAHRGTLIDMAKRMWRTMNRIGDESLFNTNYATLRTAPIGPGSIG
jgi:arylsulfatase A-like enzyme